ncbi:MAG: UDP-N-acetylmuramoyl-tripeptide--D-alanyl-D-alanine ligase [Candidatus Dichloromethanomonas elyunquensis]|nr:MAG: UDP-N-acetylmuramoyl-tripeptide--D-alanyl-D-alanine ligase [Candidatus Dichloromethanomonas elyunquensis]
MWNSARIAEILRAELSGSEEVPYTGVSIDSRKVGKGEIFVALRGEKTDGHQYIGNAFQAGASMVIAEKKRLNQIGIPVVPPGKAIIAVGDSLQALQELARSWRKEINPKVIGITGSSGKTTTKDMVASVLAQKYRVHKNIENYNNEIGLPLTILAAPAGTEMMVLEMGMRGLGQIKALCDICRPAAGVITNIGTTHMELLGSYEKIAEAKWELIENLSEERIAVLNTEDRCSVLQSERSAANIIFYGIKGEYHKPDVLGANIQAQGTMGTDFQVTVDKEHVDVRIPLPGDHHVLDALAALAVGHCFDISLKAGAAALRDFQLSKMRLEVFRGVFDSILLNDVYNANPASMKASLQVLAERGGTKTIAILGEMYELGDASVSGHQEVGKVVAQLGISELIAVGKLTEDIVAGALQAGMPEEKIHTCSDCFQAANVAREIIRNAGPAATVLIKGSRGMKMESISGLLRE